MKRFHILRTMLCILLCLTVCTPSLASVLTIPKGTTIIKEETFYGDASLDEVIVPEGVTVIEERAFADSGLTKISLPSSLETIADNAIDHRPDIEVIAEPGTRAYDWAVSQGFISAEEGKKPKITGYEQLSSTSVKLSYQMDGDLSFFRFMVSPDQYYEHAEEDRELYIDPLQANGYYTISGLLNRTYYVWLEAFDKTDNWILKTSAAYRITLESNETNPPAVPDVMESMSETADGRKSYMLSWNLVDDALGYTLNIQFPGGKQNIVNLESTQNFYNFGVGGVYGLFYIGCKVSVSAVNGAGESKSGEYTVREELHSASVTGAFTGNQLTIGSNSSVQLSGTVTSQEDIESVGIAVSGSDGIFTDYYASRSFSGQHVKQISLSDWEEFIVTTPDEELSANGAKIGLFVKTVNGATCFLDSMTVHISDEIPPARFITFESGSGCDFIGQGEEVTSSAENGDIVSRINYPLHPGMLLNIPFSTDPDAVKVTVKLRYWNEEYQTYYTCQSDNAEVSSSTTEFQINGEKKTGVLQLALPDQDHLPEGIYLLQLWSKNSNDETVDARVEIAIVKENTPSAETLSLSESTWILGSVFSEQKSIKVTSDSDWNVLSDSVPDWIAVLNASGQSGDSFCLSCEANYGMARMAGIRIACGSAAVTLEIIQPGASDETKINFASITGLTLIGTQATIQLSVKNADSVAVMTDGRLEGEPVSVRNGIQTIRHIFENGGDQSVVLIPYRNGIMGTPYSMGIIHIREFGDLTAPALNCNQEMILGETGILSWPEVPNAETYAVKLAFNDNPENSWLLYAPTTEFELTPDIIKKVGTYSITVTAQAYGYHSVSSTAVMVTRLPEINFAITNLHEGDSYIKGDLMDIQVSNPDRYHIAVKVTSENPNDPVIWLPADGSTCSDEMITETFYFQPAASQTYTFEPMAWPNGTRGSEDTAWRDSSRQVSITIDGPVFTGVDINHSQAKVRMYSDISTLSVKTNNAVTSVSVYPDDAAEPAETKVADDGYEQDSEFVRKWEFELTAPAAGQYHTYRITASDGSKTINTSLEFYCVADSELSAVYSRENNQPVYRFPTGQQQDRIGTISMMEEYQLLGTYNEYSYIHSSKFNGFVLSSMLTDQIVYDTEKIDLGFIEGQSEDTQFVYTYIGAPGITIQWQSNKQSFNNNLVYRLKSQPQTRSGNAAGSYTEFKGTTATWTPSASGAFKLLLELFDKVTDETVKTVVSSTTYVVYPDKQTYINEQSEFERSLIDTRANTFTNAANYFNAMDISQTSDNPFVKIYQLLDLKFDTLVELQSTKAEDIADAILCSMAATQGKAETISAEEARTVMEYLGVPADIISLVITFWIEDHNRIIYGGLINKLEKCNTILDYGLPACQTAVNVAESLINAIAVIDQFVKVPDEQILALAQQYNQTDDPLLKEVAARLYIYRTEIGRIGYAAEKVNWSFMEGSFSIGKTLAINAFKEAIGGSVLMGISTGTGIADLAWNTGDIAASSTKAKWAIEALNEYMPRFTTIKNNFINNPTPATYQAFAHAVMACQQLVINAYSKMIEFMNAVDDSHWYDDSWLNSTDFLQTQKLALNFQRYCNYLIQALDSYWSVWLADDCEQVVIPTSNILCP